jgi:hypothetical protein
MPRREVFPITEIFGYEATATTAEAKAGQAGRLCPFLGGFCEKFRQYGYGYCSVPYAALHDTRTRYTFAVCDHRLDGPPVQAAIEDHFTDAASVIRVPEIVLTSPRTSFDYVAFRSTDTALSDLIAIETQAIDLRGGGVGPAWKAWQDGRPEDWRQYFTEEAERKGRRDTVAYGVNMANIYKRLGLQVGEKGLYLKNLLIPFYVVMQNRPFVYLHSRIPFQVVAENAPWDITFVTFEYTERVLDNGMLELAPAQKVRTTLESYVSAMSQDRRASLTARQEFIDIVKRKAGL